MSLTRAGATRKQEMSALFSLEGGDDVQQLCEAGEAEFLEIMDLVGMAAKPMHVRRLQKALQEWVQNPNPGKTQFFCIYKASFPFPFMKLVEAVI